MSVKWVTVKKAAEITGYSAKAIDRKREAGVWLENEIWIRAPDGRILISPEGIEKWAEGQVYVPQVRTQSKSASSTKVSSARSG